MERFCDLHTHSVFSDGTCTPAQIIDRAVALGLSTVALTDHDSVDGLPEFLAAAQGQPVEAVAGGEFAVEYEGTELHLLGLFIPPAAFGRIAALMEQVHRRREQCVRDLVDSLNREGYGLDFAAMKAGAKGQVTRAHVAVAIEAQGRMDAQTAFRTLLQPGAGHYQSPRRLAFLQVLDVLCQEGAVPVLAHPFLNMTQPQLEDFLPQAKQWGLAGMECIYSAYSDQQIQTSFTLANRFGLLPSGGSDFHGDLRKEAPLGNGNRPIPDHFADDLKKGALSWQASLY